MRYALSRSIYMDLDEYNGPTPKNRDPDGFIAILKQMIGGIRD
jgi:hypothetical protein